MDALILNTAYVTGGVVVLGIMLIMILLVALFILRMIFVARLARRIRARQAWPEYGRVLQELCRLSFYLQWVLGFEEVPESMSNKNGCYFTRYDRG